VSDLDESSTSSRRSSRRPDFAFPPSSLTPLPVEAPVNTSVTQEAIKHILPATSDLVQTTPVNEIFNEDHGNFHAMDTQVEKALLTTFVSDEKEMERALGTGFNESSLADELLAFVNDEQPTMMAPPAGPHVCNMERPVAPFTSPAAPTYTTATAVPGNPNNTTSFASAPGLSPLATGAVSEFNFPRKVYRMLDDAENNPAYKAIVSWVEEGMAFKVHSKKEFVDKILPIYFDMTQYASFRRQLNMYSFERKHTSTYSNPFFVRGCPDLLEKIARKSGSTKGKK